MKQRRKKRTQVTHTHNSPAWWWEVNQINLLAARAMRCVTPPGCMNVHSKKSLYFTGSQHSSQPRYDAQKFIPVHTVYLTGAYDVYHLQFMDTCKKEVHNLPVHVNHQHKLWKLAKEVYTLPVNTSLFAMLGWKFFRCTQCEQTRTNGERAVNVT